MASCLNSLINRKKYKINQCYFDYISSSCQNQSVLHYFFILLTLYVNIIMITIKTIIDSEIIMNFIFQFKIKKYKFVEIDI